MEVFYRRLPKFEYVQPGSIEAALSFLSEKKGEAKVAAGGTDLIVQLRRREIPIPKYVVDINNLSQLKEITLGRSGLQIGALAPITAIAESADVKKKYPAIAQAAINIASTQIRNKATFAGNICNAVPSADSAPALLVLEAEVKLKNSTAERSVPIKDFFTGPRKTVTADDELVTNIFVPEPPANSKSVYLKHSQRHSMDLALVGVAALAVKDGDTCKEVRIALGAVAPTPIRASKTEGLLTGKKISKELIEEAAQQAADECSPIDDHRSSAEYRRDMVLVLARRALTEVLL